MGILARPDYVCEKRTMNQDPQKHTIRLTKDKANSDLPHYEIKIKGPIDDQWQIWFNDLAIILEVGRCPSMPDSTDHLL